MTTSLSILGASARAAAGSAVRAGFRPFAIDLFADVDTQAMARTIRIADYPSEFAKVVDQLPEGPWIYTGGLENYPDLIDTIAAQRPLWGNYGEVLRAVRQPELWSDVLKRGGISVPRIASNIADVPRDGTWLAKPLRSAGGIGIAVVDEKYQLSQELAGNSYLQERISGTPVSAVYVAARGKARLIGTTEQLSGASWTGAPPFLYAGSIGPLDLSDDALATITRTGDALAAAFALQGLFGVDGILNEAEFWPIEINPRYTASIEILERASGANFVKFHADACRDGILPSPISFGTEKHGKAVLYATRDVTFTQAAANWSADWNAPQALPVVADIPTVTEGIPAGSPVVTLIAGAKALELVTLTLHVLSGGLREVLEEVD
jgi:predicted ATP-grasp superfamily ATP-dependent carboligase